MAKDVAEPLFEHLGEADRDFVIALGKLFCIVRLAVHCGTSWEGSLVMCVTDNESSKVWLQ